MAQDERQSTTRYFQQELPDCGYRSVTWGSGSKTPGRQQKQHKPTNPQKGQGRVLVEAFIEQAGFFGSSYLGCFYVDDNANIWSKLSNNRETS